MLKRKPCTLRPSRNKPFSAAIQLHAPPKLNRARIPIPKRAGLIPCPSQLRSRNPDLLQISKLALR